MVRLSSFALLLSVVCSAFSVSPALAITGAIANPEPRMCADILLPVYHPTTGEELVARDLCEYNDLLEQGYLPEKPEMCAQAFGYVRHPQTGATLTYHNSCQLEAFLKAGYTLLLRKP